MPHLRLRAIEKPKLKKLAAELVPALAELLKTPEAHFTVELVATDFILGGQDPFCEMLWFDRGQELQDQVAQLISAKLKELSPASDPVVVFVKLSKDSYYENGQHF